RHAAVRRAGAGAAAGLSTAAGQAGGRTAAQGRGQGRRDRGAVRAGTVSRAQPGLRRRRPDRRARVRRGQRPGRDQRAGGRPRTQRGALPAGGYRRGAGLAAAGGTRMTTPNLDLGVIGNGSFGALVDSRARVVWSCMPAFDGDPAFCALLEPRDHDGGDFSIELEDFERSEQAYITNTAILRTVLYDSQGGAVEIIDFAPRWHWHDRFYRPVTIMRQVTPLAGHPRIRVRLRPLTHWGAHRAETTWGSNHVRYLLPDYTLRLTTDVPVRFVRDELPFVLTRPVHLLLGPDETVTRSLTDFMHEARERTADYWREWVRYLSIPLEWQDAVIRSAITLKLCQYEDSGAIIAAMTTSIPEAPHTPRNWDYRYCWLRDAAFVVRALNRLGATRSMEE